MNILAAAGLGIYFLEQGGPQAADDIRVLAGVYRGVTSGQPVVLSDDLLDAATRLMKIAATALKDPTEKANIISVIQSLG